MKEIKKAIAVLEIRKLFFNKESETYNAIELSIKSLEMQHKMMERCEGSCIYCPYYNPNFGQECMNDFIIETK